MNNPKLRISNPKCKHAARGHVSWPRVEDLRVGETHASTLCCDREVCITDAKWWVEAHTGHEGIWQPMEGIR